MAHVGSGTVAVVGDGINDDRNAAGRIAFIGDLLVGHVGQFTARLLDGALNIVIRHIVGFRLGNDVAQLAVGFGVCAAIAHSNRDFTANLGENSAAGSIRLALLRLNIMPLGMPRHQKIPPEKVREAPQTGISREIVA